MVGWAVGVVVALLESTWLGFCEWWLEGSFVGEGGGSGRAACCALQASPRPAVHTARAPPTRRGEDSREGRLLLGRQQAVLLDLAAAAHFHSSGAGGEVAGGGDDDFEAEALPARKRRRVAPLLTGLSAKLAARPCVWCPVLARLLLGYGLALPAEAYADWLRQLAALAPAHFPEHFMPDEHDADAALWLLRLAHALALAWPLHLAASGSGRGGSDKDGLPSPAVVQEQWGVSASLWVGCWSSERTCGICRACVFSLNSAHVVVYPPCRRLSGRLCWGMPSRPTCQPPLSPRPWLCCPP